MIKRIGYGIVGAVFGSFCAYLAMTMLGKIYWAGIIIVFVIGFMLSFFGGRRVVRLIFDMEDYIP